MGLFSGRKPDTSPTHLVIDGRPVFLSRRNFDALMLAVFPDDAVRAMSKVRARMVSDGNPAVRRARTAVWRQVTEWLEEQRAVDPDRFEEDWVLFLFSDSDAGDELRELLVAWAEFSSSGTAIATSAANQQWLGVELRHGRGEVLTGVATVDLISGSLEEFEIKTYGGSLLQLDRNGIRCWLA